MSEVIKSYMGVFLLLLMTLAAGEILAGYMQVLGAQNLHSEILSELEDSNYYSGVVDAVMPSIVAITNTGTVTYQSFFGMSQSYETESCGSGIIVAVNIGTEVVFFTAISTMGMIVVSVLGSGIYIASQKPKDILSKMS